MRWRCIGQKTASVFLVVALSIGQPAVYADAGHIPAEIFDSISFEETMVDHSPYEEYDSGDTAEISGTEPVSDTSDAEETEPTNGELHHQSDGSSCCLARWMDPR